MACSPVPRVRSPGDFIIVQFPRRSAGQPRVSKTVEARATIVGDRHRERFRIEDVYPSVDGGRYAVKRVTGEPVDVWADIFRDGHDVSAAELRWRLARHAKWQRVPMHLHQNDRWTATFVPGEVGRHVFQIAAW